jgi:hypothetical protein
MNARIIAWLKKNILLVYWHDRSFSDEYQLKREFSFNVLLLFRFNEACIEANTETNART